MSSEEDSNESDTVSDNEENSQDDLVIADLDEQSIVQMPFLTFVPDEQTAEVTVQARTEWKIKHKKRHKQRKNEQKTKKSYTKNYKGKGNRKSVILALPDDWIPAKCSKWDLVDC